MCSITIEHWQDYVLTLQISETSTNLHQNVYLFDAVVLLTTVPYTWNTITNSRLLRPQQLTKLITCYLAQSGALIIDEMPCRDP